MSDKEVENVLEIGDASLCLPTDPLLLCAASPHSCQSASLVIAHDQVHPAARQAHDEEH
jgi:hypothetical protein